MSLLKSRKVPAHFEIERRADGRFWWMLIGHNGKAIAQSCTGYKSEAYIRGVLLPDLLRIYIPEATNQPAVSR